MDSLNTTKKNTLTIFQKQTVLVAFFILNSPILSAQNENELKGRIKTAAPSGGVVNIVNQNTKKWTITQANGKFQIPVKEGDTVLFSSLQYQPKRILITQKILKKDSVEVSLNVQVYELTKVHLKNNLSHDLPEAVKDLSYFDQAEVGFPLTQKKMTVGERRLKVAQSGSLDPLLNALSGRTKMIKRQVKHERTEKGLKDLKKALPIDYILNSYHIPEEAINEFLYFCIEDKEIKAALRRNNSLEVIELSKEKARIFLNRSVEK